MPEFIGIRESPYQKAIGADPGTLAPTVQIISQAPPAAVQQGVDVQAQTSRTVVEGSAASFENGDRLRVETVDVTPLAVIEQEYPAIVVDGQAQPISAGPTVEEGLDSFGLSEPPPPPPDNFDFVPNFEQPPSAEDTTTEPVSDIPVAPLDSGNPATEPAAGSNTLQDQSYNPLTGELEPIFLHFNGEGYDVL